MSAVPALAGGGAASAARPISLRMRIVLGYLHAGALLLQAARDARAHAHWRSRAFPEERIADATVRALEERQLVEIAEYQVGETLRCCAVLTAAGREAYRAMGGRYAGARAVPPAAEALVAKFDDAIAAIAGEMENLSQRAAAMLAQAEEARRMMAAAVKDGEAIARRIAELTRLNGHLSTLREEQRAMLTGAARASA